MTDSDAGTVKPVREQRGEEVWIPSCYYESVG
jgi:hypothetical protein